MHLPIVWSVVIPAYNEAHRLPRYLREVLAYFEQRQQSYEILVVDDGSTDCTPDLVRQMAATHPALGVHVLPRNRGKGYAVRVGMQSVRGVRRLMADADGATPIAELPRFEAAVNAGAGIAVGSRALADPGVVRTR